MAVEKIAFISDDGDNLSSHFGQAEHVVVITLEDGKVLSRELRDKATGRHGQHDRNLEQVSWYGGDIKRQHDQMPTKDHHAAKFETMQDCSVLIARGMGVPAMTTAENMGLRVMLVAPKTVDEALQAYLDGTLEHDQRRLHKH